MKGFTCVAINCPSKNFCKTYMRIPLSDGSTKNLMPIIDDCEFFEEITDFGEENYFETIKLADQDKRKSLSEKEKRALGYYRG